jgi:hypothetical protein
VPTAGVSRSSMGTSWRNGTFRSYS